MKVARRGEGSDSAEEEAGGEWEGGGRDGMVG